MAGYDVVGDVHGMVATLREMVEQLGYREVDGRWSHPEARVLVSVGDLLDRGPDPLGCLELVSELVRDGCGHMVLGNHELNALHFLDGLREDNAKHRKQIATTLAQIEADPARWARLRTFIESQPLHLELDGGQLRIVHACWDVERIAELPTALGSDPQMLAACSEGGALWSAVQTCLKGPERKSAPHYDKEGTRRTRRRIAWWESYPEDAPLVCFGHYWFPNSGFVARDSEPAFLGAGRNAACLDWSVGLGGDLVALRYPERVFVKIPCADLDRS